MAAHHVPQIAEPWFTVHPLSSEDAKAIVAMRAVVAPNKGLLQGTAARAPYDGIMLKVVAPEGVTYHKDTVGGVPGWWCKPAMPRPGWTLLHLHGGWFNWGSAEAYRSLVGHIARSASAVAFVPDYRLAPEHPFPAAVEDAEACLNALGSSGSRRIALTGDSAGGNLALVLLAHASAWAVPPVGALVLSPVTDLTMTGLSWESRKEADPYFTRAQVAALITSYLGTGNPADPDASPLHGKLAGLPPVSIHVGGDEVLLDDSTRYFECASAAGVNARLDLWEGMPHGSLGGIGHFAAASEALAEIGQFLSERFAAGD